MNPAFSHADSEPLTPMANCSSRIAIAGWVLAVLPLVAASGNAQLGPAPRPLPAGVAISAEPLLSLTNVRALSDGRVLVNDGLRRRLILFDSTLTRATVIADSAIGFPNQYGTRAGVLVPARGDTSLLMDGASLSMLVVDPNGKIVRTRAIPRSVDAVRIASPYTGVDAHGRIVYRGLAASRPPIIPQGGGISLPEQPDSIPLVRIDIETRVLDTVAKVKIARMNTVVTQSATGGISIRSQQNPLPMVDEWVATSDGSVALIRGRDYHIDWVRPDGSLVSSPKMPFDWQRMEYEAKVAFLDSAKTAMEAARKRSYDLMIARYDSMSLAAQQGKGAPPPPLPPMDQYMGPAMGVVEPDALPDYKPPFSTGAVRADADGNVWIRTNPMKPNPGGVLVYDIVNNEGVLVDRIQVAPPRTVVGFGPGGAVYLSVRDARGLHLQRAQLPPRGSGDAPASPPPF
jgi:hypothetical protein